MLEDMLVGGMDDFDRDHFSSSSSSSSVIGSSRSMTPLSDTSASYDAGGNSDPEY